MPHPASYLDLSLRELCDALGTEDGPGGGSAAGVTAAMAAALVTKAARDSAGSWAQAADVVEQASSLATRCAELAELDAEAFREALAALEQGEGVAAPLQRTAEVLLELAETAAQVAGLAARTAELGDGRFRGDAASGAVLAAAVTIVAEALVSVNLTVTETDARLRKAHSLSDQAAAAALRALRAGP